jgi:hypothetical protein
MARQSQTLLLVEQLQPAWLPSPGSRLAYTLLDRLGSALLAGALVGLGVWRLGYPPLGVLCFGLVATLAAGLFGGSASAPLRQPDLRELAVRTGAV